MSVKAAVFLPPCFPISGCTDKRPAGTEMKLDKNTRTVCPYLANLVEG